MFDNPYTHISLEDGYLFGYELKPLGKKFHITAPRFEINGKTTAMPEHLEITERQLMSNGVQQITATGSLGDSQLKLTVRFRLCPDNPMIKFQYILSSDREYHMTKSKGTDRLCYFSFSTAPQTALTEVRISEFNHMLHSFCPVELPAFAHEDAIMGPIITAQTDKYSYLAAYEHGSQSPDRFLEFVKNSDIISLQAVKGNYWHGQKIGKQYVFESIWMQFGAAIGTTEELAGYYRDFMLRYASNNTESRKPYIYYNTWAYQERNHAWNGKAYLDSMCQKRILEEIEIAHRMGIDVFVLDTGWYEKTGDWNVNLDKFPDNLRSVKQKLDSYGMKLGLWLNPKAAALSSVILKENQEYIAEDRGILHTPEPIWETEESYPMCLVSKYWEVFAKQLLRLSKTLGVTYFKWDAVHQYGCDSPHHNHGTADNTSQERADCYAFQLGPALAKIVDYVCEQNPNIIVDFDITEGYRSVGLGFLSSGKYFLINNGPYYDNYNIPINEDTWCNIFVYPGPARSWFMRTPLKYDKWIPSVLFLTHYLPDEPRESQMINLCSLLLGQNGIWGDLKAISEDGIQLFAEVVAEYKKVRDDVTSASPVRFGNIGESFEVHEKINPKTGRGLVVAFSSVEGNYHYRTASKTSKKIFTKGSVNLISHPSNAELIFKFKKWDAALVLFE